jgi:uncharacterized membrane protein YcfT
VPEASRRILWVDFAKAVSLILVLHLHANFYGRVLPSSEFRSLLTLPAVLDVLSFHARMPIFFFISGMLAAKRLALDTGGVVRNNIYIYLLWSLIYQLLIPDWPHGYRRAMLDPARIGAILWGGSMAWYLWGIALAFLTARLTRSWSGWLVLSSAILISELQFVAAEHWGGHAGSLLRCLPFYLLGARFPQVGHRLADSRSVTIVTVGVIAYFLFGLLLSTNILFVGVAADFAGLSLGLMGAGWAARVYPGIAGPVGWIGRHTLPIYILHFPIIALAGLFSLSLLSPLPVHHPLLQIYAPLLTGVALFACVLIYGVIVRMGAAGWLFAYPARDTRFAEAAAHRGAAPGGKVVLAVATDTALDR